MTTTTSRVRGPLTGLSEYEGVHQDAVFPTTNEHECARTPHEEVLPAPQGVIENSRGTAHDGIDHPSHSSFVSNYVHLWFPAWQPRRGPVRAFGYIRAVCAVALALCVCSAPALAQAVNVIEVDQDAVDGDPYDSLQDAIDDAVARSRTEGQYIVIIEQWLAADGTYVPYEGGIKVPADANLLIQGFPVTEPFSVLVAGDANRPALHIHTDPTSGYVGEATNRLVVEGLTFLDGLHGVWVESTVPDLVAPVKPVISRCYIRNNRVHGIVLSGPFDVSGEVFTPGRAAPLIVNCSITNMPIDDPPKPTRAQQQDGIHIVTSQEDREGIADILHCTIVLNKERGIHVLNKANTAGHSPNANARVRNTIVYRNGPEDSGDTGGTQGGVVWERDLFADVSVDPDVGYVAGGAAQTPDETVTISGWDLYLDADGDGRLDPDSTNVYFGPPTAPGALWTHSAPADHPDPNPSPRSQWLRGVYPPAYLGAPGPVDVYIRRADNFIYIVENGFTYVEDKLPNVTLPPYVTQVIPEHGPVFTKFIGDPPRPQPDPEKYNWVFVYGARFDPDCEVIFDFDNDCKPPSFPIDDDELSPRVVWLSSGKLHVKVAALPLAYYIGLPYRVHVLVRNNTSGLISQPAPVPGTSPPVYLGEYEYRADEGADQPHIVQIAPNFYRDIEGTPGPLAIKASITGWNFDDRCIVKIGNIVCPYERVNQGVPGSRTPLDEVEDVEVPVAQFGAAGAYDVELINPSGLHTVLPGGFTYYTDGVPRSDPSRWPWRPANFHKYDAAGPELFRFLGTGFDTGLWITFGKGTSSEQTLDGLNPSSGVLPSELDRQHQRHTQREIEFKFPPRPDYPFTPPSPPNPWQFDPAFPAPTHAVPVEVKNQSAMNGNPSTNQSTADTTFYWALDTLQQIGEGQAIYFGIGIPIGNLDSLSVNRNAGPNGRDEITMPVYNWRNAMKIYVHDILVQDSFNLPEPVMDWEEVTFEVPSPTPGLYGPVDITVMLLPTSNGDNRLGEPLYYVAERAYSYRVPDGYPYARAVVPRTVPVDGDATPPPPLVDVPIRVLGSNFLGPAIANGIYTRIWLDWDTTYNNGNDILLTTAPTTAQYEILSFSEIEFVFDLTPYPAATFPRDVPVNMWLEQYDAAANVILTDSLGNSLRYLLRNALVFEATAPPRVDWVTRTEPAYFDPTNPTNRSIYRRDGPVNGGTELFILGDHFAAAAAQYSIYTFVRIGGVEAKVLKAEIDYDMLRDPGADRLTVVTPPAPQGRPGTYDVVVIRLPDLLEGRAPEDQWFTYFMDGAPHITYIAPNHRSEAETGRMYATIYGYNFDDKVYVTFENPKVEDDDPQDLVRKKYFSVSPNEIVIEVPLASDFVRPLIFDDPDDPNDDPNVAEVNVDVQNQSHLPREDAQAKGLISNVTPFYYYNDNRGSVVPRHADLRFNDVYLNTRDYINAEPGIGCISVDPLLEPDPNAPHPPGPFRAVVQADALPWWLGKLALVKLVRDGEEYYYNPVRDKAGDFPPTPYKNQDFEAQHRPVRAPDDQGTGEVGEGNSYVRHADIGADEVESLDWQEVVWFFAQVTPGPAPYPAGFLPDNVWPEPIGSCAPQTISVIVGVTNLLGYPGSMSDRSGVFIVPQGGDPANPAHRIRLMQDTRNYAGGYGDFYYYTNAEAIDTLVSDEDGSGGLSQGDVVADGHATLYVDVTDVAPLSDTWANRDDDYILGYNPVDIQDGLMDAKRFGLSIYPEGGLFDGNRILGEELPLSERKGVAAYGRHFLIDTTPPRIWLPVAVSGPSYSPIPQRANFFVNLLNSNVNAALPVGYPGLDPLSGQRVRRGHHWRDWDTGYWCMWYAARDWGLFGGLAGGWPRHPYPQLPWTIGWPPLDVLSPDSGPFDYGRIGEVFFPSLPVGKGAQIFFNVGSRSNNWPWPGSPSNDPTKEALDVLIKARFEDPPPEVHSDGRRIPLEGQITSAVWQTNRDIYTGAYLREVAGFLDPTYQQGLPAYLDYVEGTALPTNAGTITDFYFPPVGDLAGDIENTGFDRLQPDEVFNFAYRTPPAPDDFPYEARADKIKVDWTFYNGAAGYPADVTRPAVLGGDLGIPWIGETTNVLHLATRFIPQDAAGNLPRWVLEPGELPCEPLHVWWMLNAQTLLRGPVDEPIHDVKNPTFTWGLDRGYAPEAQGQPMPLFTYRLWRSRNYEGPYEPVRGWSWLDGGNWSPTRRNLGPQDFSNLNIQLRASRQDPILGCWLLLLVAGADESGNIEPWPVNQLTAQAVNGDVTGKVEVKTPNDGPNWRRFFYTGGVTGGLDTTVSATFYWYDADFTPRTFVKSLGSDLTVYLPDEGNGWVVDAAFAIRASAAQHIANVKVYWELLKGTAPVVPSRADLEPPNEVRTPDILPVAYDARNRPTVLGDYSQPVVYYTFRARAYADSNNNDRWDPSELADPTPAEVAFRVVVSKDFFYRKDDVDKQPIKLQEER